MRTSRLAWIAVACAIGIFFASDAGAGRLVPRRLRKGDSLVLSKRQDLITQLRTSTATARQNYAAALKRQADVGQQKIDALKAAKPSEKSTALRDLFGPNDAHTIETLTATDVIKSSKDPAVVKANSDVASAKVAVATAIPAPLKAQGAALGLTGTDMEAAAEAEIAPTPTAAGDIFASAPLTGVSWQTAVVSGLAQFMAERANEELSMWLADEIASHLCDVDAKGGSWAPNALFPQTCALVATKPTDPSSLGGLLAAALRSDVEALPIAILGKLLKLDAASVASLQSLFQQLRQGVAPLPLLAGLGQDASLLADCQKGDPTTTPPTKPSVAGCVLVGLGDVVGSAGEVVTTGDDQAAAASMTALATATASSLATLLPCGAGSNCDPSVAGWLQKLGDPTASASVASALVQLFADARSLYQTIEQWKASSAQDASTVLARAGEVLNGIHVIGDDTIRVLEAPWLTGATATFSCAAGDSLCAAVNGIATDWSNAEPILQATSDAMKGQYADAVRELMVFVQDNPKIITLPPQVVQYVGFIVDVSQAKTANDVKSLLDTAAAPVGSWRVKRQKRFVVSVTSFVGGAGGAEMPLSLHDASGSTQYATSYGSAGLLATLGVDLSVNTGNGWTLGLYGTVLDLGQIISVPVGNGGVTSTSKPVSGGEVSFAQVFSPGGYLRLGLGNTPFVVGFGAAGAPSLRKFEHLDGASSDQVSVLRVQGFLAMDLTLFPIAALGDGN